MTPKQVIMLLSEKFGHDWINCEEPESISLCLDDDVDINDDMIGAIKTCITSNLPWADPYVFENVVDGLNGNPIVPETLSIPPLEEICVAVDLMTDMKPDMPFSDDIKKYICACAMDYGLTWLPKILLFAADFMEEDPNGIQFMVKTYIEASGYPLFDYSYQDDPVGVQLQKLAAIQQAYLDLTS